MKRFHQTECRLFQEEICERPDDITCFTSVLRLFTESLDSSGSKQKLKSSLENTEPVTIFDFDFSDNKDNHLEWDCLRIINSLLPSTQTELKNTHTLFVRNLFEEFAEDFELTPEDRDFCSDYIIRLLLIIDRNAWTLKGYENKKGSETECVYMFGSMINHSCCPNTSVISYGAKKLYFVVKPIKKNEQIFISYR
jgi:hypothetical protein